MGIREQLISAARAELDAGAREVGGNNMGPYVQKYLAPSGVKPPQPWCAAFVSWCLRIAWARSGVRPKLPYLIRARSFIREGKVRGWLVADPRPGDIVVWWRVQRDGPLGHVGIVETREGATIGTIEGNRIARAARFRYTIGRMPRLLGFVRVPD